MSWAHKTIELRGGAADGQRMSVPEGSTELSLPVAGGTAVYAPSGDRNADGLEIWHPIETWNDTGLAPL